MKISELLGMLSELLKHEGDLPVFIEDGDRHCSICKEVTINPDFGTGKFFVVWYCSHHKENSRFDFVNSSAADNRALFLCLCGFCPRYCRFLCGAWLESGGIVAANQLFIGQALAEDTDRSGEKTAIVPIRVFAFAEPETLLGEVAKQVERLIPSCRNKWTLA